MKATILLLISLLLIGCGSRNKSLNKTEDQTRFENNSSFKNSTSSANNTLSFTDFRNFLINKNLKIKSTGQPYELKFGDLVFSGSADLEFTEKKEETIIHHVYQIHTTYITETKYQTKTNYQKQINSKSLNTNRSGLTFGNLIGIIICSLISGMVLWELLKRLIFRK